MTVKFKIKTPKGVKKLAFDFNIKRIIRDFHSIEEPEERCRFIQRKLEEVSTADSCRREMNLLAKMKLAYLLDFRHLDLILSGFLGEANVDLEILTKVQSQQ
jgi:hypothetical protein